ncbi:MAG: SGNH/GDSL hydrolase family protein [Bacillota bacterium]|jgi:acyl-CoA thioesterase-1
MNDVLKIGVYGDSIMRATVPDENLRYHFKINEFMEYFKGLPLKIVNHAKFGATVSKGEAILEKDAMKGLDYDLVLIEYGGNDCDHNWAEVAENPNGIHLPNTELNGFIDTVDKMTDLVMAEGGQPVLMTLPPIDPQKYFDYLVSKGLNRSNLMSWLGDVSLIYRFHEMYSNAIEKLAARKNLLCVDVRTAFLAKHDFKDLISQDGIHPTKSGYKVIFSELLNSVRRYGQKNGISTII